MNPTAPALRRELVALLRIAAAKSAEWSEAAQREWAPHAEEYGKEGAITPANEHAYMERSLARAWSGRVQAIADRLDVPSPAPLSHSQALEIACRAADAFVRQNVVRDDEQGRSEARTAALKALESCEPGQWDVVFVIEKHGHRLAVKHRWRPSP